VVGGGPRGGVAEGGVRLQLGERRKGGRAGQAARDDAEQADQDSRIGEGVGVGAGDQDEAAAGGLAVLGEGTRESRVGEVVGVSSLRSL